MVWLGKITGGIIGLLFGGPVGMVIGIFIGHQFDKATRVEYTAQPTSLDQRQMYFFAGAFSLLGKVAAIDGSVSEQERARVIAFINTQLRLSTQQAQLALSIFETASKSEESFDHIAMQFAQTFRFEPAILQVVLEMLVQVAIADGRITTAEEALVRRAAQIFGFPMHIVDHFIARYSPQAAPNNKAYATLGLSPSASDAEVKAAYRRLSREFHPDTLASQGMGDEFSAHATAKFRDIQEAWETVKTERKIS
ncbi:MAG TPA: co-chaperone DjlA [Sphaerochaeta sp.]|nr:co-chaperone DjlA [Sphaerochaeta sp.]